MITMLKNWQGVVEVDGQQYTSVNTLINSGKAFDENWHIKLLPKVENSVQSATVRSMDKVVDLQEYRITVKAYMTRPTEPGSTFDFMEKWNNNKPMPLRTMQGIILKETRGMVQMKLHGVGLAEVNCMCCGRKLTNLVSRHYGIGPECMKKVGIIADINDVDEIREKLQEVEWTGWVIKSAILEQEEVA